LHPANKESMSAMTTPYRKKLSERTPRPPKMQRGRMPVADRLFTCRRFVDLGERQSDFDEFLAVGSGHGAHRFLVCRVKTVEETNAWDRVKSAASQVSARA